MNRRHFFGLAAAAPIALKAAAVESLAPTAALEPVIGFGLATLKTEGVPFTYDSLTYGLGYAITRMDIDPTEWLDVTGSRGR